MTVFCLNKMYPTNGTIAGVNGAPNQLIVNLITKVQLLGFGLATAMRIAVNSGSPGSCDNNAKIVCAISVGEAIS